MNRANFGNVITNGMQILSVGATTASHFIAQAHKNLNNKEQEQLPEIQQKQQADIDWQAKYKQDISNIQNALQPVYEKFKQKEQEIGGNENADV